MLLALTPAAARSGSRAGVHGLLLSGTVVTMGGSHHVYAAGHVLVRGNRIAAVWSGRPPRGLNLRGVRTLPSDRRTLIFPGLIDLHAHPSFSVLPLWPPPSSHAEPQDGRPHGTEPYDNRYQWSGDNRPPEQRRLVRNAKDALG